MGFALKDPDGKIIFRSTLENTPENVIAAGKQHAANMRSNRQRDLLPGQSIGPASDDVSQRMRDLSIGFSSQYDPAASLIQQGVGSLPTDPENKVKYYASQFFPNTDPKEAMRNFSYTPEGQLTVFDPQVKAYRLVEPDVSIKKPTTYPAAIAQNLGDLIVDAGATGGAIVGTLARQPYTGTAMGTLAADTTRNFLSAFLAGEEKPFFDRAFDMGQRVATETAITGLGEAGGFAFERIRKLAKTDKSKATKELEKLAKNLGIRLSTAQAAKSTELALLQEVLRNTTDSGAILKEFDTLQDQQTKRAVLKWINSVQPNPTKKSNYDLAVSGQQGAQAAITQEQAERRAKAQPFYDASVNMDTFAYLRNKPNTDYTGNTYNQIQWEQDLKQWQLQRAKAMKDPELQAELEPIKKRMVGDRQDKLIEKEAQLEVLQARANNTTLPAAEQSLLNKQAKQLKKEIATEQKEIDNIFNNSMYVVNTTNKYINRQIDKFTNSASPDPNKVRLLQRSRKNMLKIIDEQVPDYKTAREIFEEGSPAVTRLEQGVVGRAAGRSELQVQNIPNLVLGSAYANPESVKLARDAFFRAGRGDAWNDLVMAFLKQKNDEAIKQMPVGGDKSGFSNFFLKSVYGDEEQKKILKEALGGDTEIVKNMEWLMDVLEAQRYTYGQNSKTAFYQSAQKVLEEKGEGLGPKSVRLLAFWKTPERIAEAWARYNRGEYNTRLAELMTTGAGRRAFSELRKIKPKTQAGINALLQVLASGADLSLTERERAINVPELPLYATPREPYRIVDQ
jgi:hypothetical protein